MSHFHGGYSTEHPGQVQGGLAHLGVGGGGQGEVEVEVRGGPGLVPWGGGGSRPSLPPGAREWSSSGGEWPGLPTTLAHYSS